MEILIILLLIVVNGMFAMAEAAIIASRKHKLQKQAQEGNENAKKALDLAENPNRFLSTTQVGITLIGIFAGAFGGATIAHALQMWLVKISLLSPYSDALSLAIVVIIITYLSLIIGELVPKRIALSNPEKIASFMAPSMETFSRFTIPIISLLSVSTDFVLKLLRIKIIDESGVSEDEVKMLIREGTKAGIFEQTEKNIVERTFRLSDRQVNSLMRSRKQIIWLELDSSLATIQKKLLTTTHSYYPVCTGTLDKVIGIVRTEDALKDFLEDGKMNLQKSLHKPLFIPSTTPALKILELFKKSGIHLALIIDEYGMIEGLISLTDILEAIVGDIPAASEIEEKEIIKRDSKSWLIDGLISTDEFKDYFQIKKLPDERSGNYHTLGGFVMSRLDRIPISGDRVEYDDYIYEIVDMDENRVSKVLLTKSEN
ncbi:MAG: hemolysin family protein [Candidatus Levyibacteriota bacterium]